MSIDRHHPSCPVFLVPTCSLIYFCLVTGYEEPGGYTKLISLTGKVVRICRKGNSFFFFKVQPHGKVKIKKSSHEFWAIKPKA